MKSLTVILLVVLLSTSCLTLAVNSNYSNNNNNNKNNLQVESSETSLELVPELVSENGYDGNLAEVVVPNYQNELFAESSNEINSSSSEHNHQQQKKSLFSSKRTQNKDQIVSFFRNALARNYKLKSNIKTTRF